MGQPIAMEVHVSRPPHVGNRMEEKSLNLAPSRRAAKKIILAALRLGARFSRERETYT
jgi:hypothetical protein